jgi:hypothetical protein
MSKYLFMADTDSDEPAESLEVQAYAGYVETSYDALVAKFYPGHHIFSIAMHADRDAECLDIENGDATAADARDWYERMAAKGVYRPCLYASEANMEMVEEEMADVPRENYRLWIAAWSPEHPETLLDKYDAHQYYGTSSGPYDYSILRDDFFKGSEKKPAQKVSPKRAASKPAPKSTGKGKVKSTDIHPKVAGAGLAGAVATAVMTVLKTHGVHIDATESSSIATLAAVLAGYLAPHKRSEV